MNIPQYTFKDLCSSKNKSISVLHVITPLWIESRIIRHNLTCHPTPFPSDWKRPVQCHMSHSQELPAIIDSRAPLMTWNMGAHIISSGVWRPMGFCSSCVLQHFIWLISNFLTTGDGLLIMTVRAAENRNLSTYIRCAVNMLTFTIQIIFPKGCLKALTGVKLGSGY